MHSMYLVSLKRPCSANLAGRCAIRDPSTSETGISRAIVTVRNTNSFSMMLPVLPFETIELIIEAVGENKDINLLKELALVSHSFHQVCSKHLFATVELHDAVPRRHVASSKKGFVKLLNIRPDVVKYIRKLTYKMEYYYPQSSSIHNDDELLSPILPNFLRTIPSLNHLIITPSEWLDWNELNSSLTSAFLHLMRLPTVNHIDLSLITNFPLSSFTPSVNLHRLEILCVLPSDPIREDGEPEDGPFEFVQSGMMPKLREFHTSGSDLMAKQLLLAKGQDGLPAFNFIDLIGLSMPFERDDRNIRYILQNTRLLEKLHLRIGSDRSLVELHEILSPSARTLKVLDLTVFLYGGGSVFLGGICEELEALAGQNMLEALSLRVIADSYYETADFIGSTIQKVEGVLVKPGWSALRKVSFKLEVGCVSSERAKFSESLQSLPDKYLSHLSKLDSVAFNYSVEVF